LLSVAINMIVLILYLTPNPSQLNSILALALRHSKQGVLICVRWTLGIGIGIDIGIAITILFVDLVYTIVMMQIGYKRQL